MVSEEHTRPTRRELRLARLSHQANSSNSDTVVLDHAEDAAKPCDVTRISTPLTACPEPEAVVSYAGSSHLVDKFKRFFGTQSPTKVILSTACAFAVAVGSGFAMGPLVFESLAVAKSEETVLQGVQELDESTPSHLRALSGAADSARYRAYEEQFSGKPIVCQTTASANSLTSVLRDKVDHFIHPMAAGTFRESSPFGWRIHPILGSSKLHEGVDYAAPIGTPIYAVADGKVVFSGSDSYTLGAPVLIIQHKVNGVEFTSWYLHSFSEGIHVKEGDEVKMGDHVADVGNSGRSTGAHLHFEIHPGTFTGFTGAGPVDPIAFMKEHGAVDIHDVCGAK